ncbi:MAG: dihydropteroate synthase [Pseudomonadota bacterium]|nr:dihydropteroate synthase [Pseudomonadota bacterium]
MTIEHNGLIVIGENFNTSRKIKGSSPRVFKEEEKYFLKYTDLDGKEGSLDITDGFPEEPDEQKKFMIPHITHAVKNDDKNYINWIVKNQEKNGAHFIDLCVDEISYYPEERLEWMQAAVKIMQSMTKKPIALDSSDSETIKVGLEVYDRSISRPAINSVNLEPPRLPLIQMAKEMDTYLFANAGGADGMPADDKERTENLVALMDMMDEAEIPMDDRYLDPLVFPIGANPQFGNHYLDSVSTLRKKYPDVHIFGGHSNASFGLPGRKVLNNAFISLSVHNGCDSVMIDPVMNSINGIDATSVARRMESLEDPNEKDNPEVVEFRLGVDVLTGKDDFSMNFIQYWRSKDS